MPRMYKCVIDGALVHDEDLFPGGDGDIFQFYYSCELPFRPRGGETIYLSHRTLYGKRLGEEGVVSDLQVASIKLRLDRGSIAYDATHGYFEVDAEPVPMRPHSGEDGEIDVTQYVAVVNGYLELLHAIDAPIWDWSFGNKGPARSVVEEDHETNTFSVAVGQ